MKHIVFGDFAVQEFATGTDGAGNFVGLSYCVFDCQDSRYTVWGLASKEKAINVAKRHYRVRKLQKMIKKLMGRK